MPLAEKYKKIFLSNQKAAFDRPFEAYGARVSPQGFLLLFAEFFFPSICPSPIFPRPHYLLPGLQGCWIEGMHNIIVLQLK